MPWPRLGKALFAGVALSLAAMRGVVSHAQMAGSATPSDNHTPRLIPRTSAEREQRFLSQHRVILNVRVADPTGRALSELQQNDFTLYDNNQARKVQSVRLVDGAAGGAHVIVVLDAVNRFSNQVRNDAKEVERYLKEGSGLLAYPVAIGVFSGFSIEVGQPSRDRETLRGELNTRTEDLHAGGCITQQDHGPTPGSTPSVGAMGNMRAESAQELVCKNERFVRSVNALLQLARKEVDSPGRVILIWIGPGWPMLTDRSFTPDPPDLKRNFFAQLVQVSTALREAQVTVNAVASPDESINPQTPNVRDSNFFEGVVSEDQASAANLGLHVLAHQTGGNILTAAKDLAGQIGACIGEADSYYVLSFDAPPAAGFGEYHALAIKVAKPGVDVRTNTLYYPEQ